MIKRTIQAELLTQLTEYPIVTVLGPRQAGKTTLVKTALPDYRYVSLEIPETRQFATDDRPHTPMCQPATRHYRSGIT